MLIAYGMSGGDITDVTCDGKINAAKEWVYQNPKLLSGGLNAMVFALQALDVCEVKLPKDALNTREDIIDSILSLQLSPSGGFTLAGSVPDPDMTAMVITALAPYYSENKMVASAIEQALKFLSKTQQNNGGFKSFGVAGCESAAQVVIALTTLGIDPEADGRFVKSGGNPFAVISEFKVSKGEYSHIVGGKSGGIATGQAFCAYAAYWRFLNGYSSLYAPNGAKLPVYNPLEGEDKPTSSNKSVSQTSSKSGAVPSQNDVNNISSSVNVSDISHNASSFSDTKQETNLILNDTKLQENNKEVSKNPLRIKHIIAIILLVLAVIIAVIIFILTKKGYRILKQPCASLIVGVIAFTLVGVLLLTIRIQSVNDYYSDTESASENSAGTVTVKVECTRLLEKSEVVPKSLESYIPKDGYILQETTIPIGKGDTVFSVLKRVAKQKKIPLEYSTTGGAYVEGIGYLYEFSCGELSGWVYSVNSKQSEVSSSEYILSNGDNIVWSYSLELGQDIFNK